jgi:hypothetical protein
METASGLNWIAESSKNVLLTSVCGCLKLTHFLLIRNVTTVCLVAEYPTVTFIRINVKPRAIATAPGLIATL